MSAKKHVGQRVPCSLRLWADEFVEHLPERELSSKTNRAILDVAADEREDCRDTANVERTREQLLAFDVDRCDFDPGAIALFELLQDDVNVLTRATMWRPKVNHDGHIAALHFRVKVVLCDLDHGFPLIIVVSTLELLSAQYVRGSTRRQALETHPHKTARAMS